MSKRYILTHPRLHLPTREPYRDSGQGSGDLPLYRRDIPVTLASLRFVLHALWRARLYLTLDCPAGMVKRTELHCVEDAVLLKCEMAHLTCVWGAFLE